MGKSIYELDFPKLALTPQDYKEILAVSTSEPVRRKDGSIDFSKTPACLALERKEKEALKALGADSVEGRAATELDAFQRQLEIRKITNKTNLDIFWDPQNVGLFPEVVERAVLMSTAELDINELKPEDIIAITKPVDSKVVLRPKLTLPTPSQKPTKIAQGAEPPTYTITESDETITLSEYGFKIVIGDSAAASQSIDQLQVMVKEIASNEIYRRQVEDAVLIAIAAGFTSVSLASSTVLTTKDIFKMFLTTGGSRGREPDILFSVSDDTGAVISLVEVLNLSDLRNPIANPGGITSREFPTVLGKPLRFCNVNSTGGAYNLKNKLVGIKKAYGIQKYEYRGVMQSEIERIAKMPGNAFYWRTAIGFNRFTADSVRILVP
jgi:hypothetical protein